MRTLSDAGLVSVTKRGRTRYCKLEPIAMHQAAEWLNEYRVFWENQLSSLEAYLLEDKT